MGPSLSEFQARPGQDLANHTDGVVACGRALVSDAGTNPYGDEWVEIIETIAYVHDIGKLTEYFQAYLETGNRSAAPAAELTYHGTFGALVAAAALMKRDFDRRTVVSGFYAVAKHHGVLEDIPSDLRGYYQVERQVVANQYDTAERQLQNIDRTADDAADTLVSAATNEAYGWREFVDSGVRQTASLLKWAQSEVPDEYFYGTTLRAWSTLVTADKMDASGLTAVDDLSRITPQRELTLDTIDEHITDLATTPMEDGTPAAVYLDHPSRELPSQSTSHDQRLAAIRTAGNGRACERLHDRHADGDRVFEISLPTGFGKTITSLRAGVSLADELGTRVVYALPYTSIIDQVDEEIQEIFGVTPTSPAYTKHHHLADTRTLHADETPASGRDTLHAEAWRSDLTLTTFVQLFETLAGPNNTQSVKLPALQNAVILIDEPQAISLDWWGLLGRLSNHLTEEYDATVVFVTATQPRILESLSDVPTPTPLVDLRTESADLLRDKPRVTFDLHQSLTDNLDQQSSEPLSLTDAADTLDRETTGSENTLAIVNTVGSAGALTSELTESYLPLASRLLEYLQFQDAGGETFRAVEYLDHLKAAYPDTRRVVVTLTTRLRPVDRQAIIDCLDAILDPKTDTPFDGLPTITVSTQLIEAGVDVSFDRLYRDIAPLPAIVQAAGRCNRVFGGDPSSATVWRLDSPRDQSYVPSELVYENGSLLRPTRDVLSELRGKYGNRLPEAEIVTTGVDDYYSRLHTQLQTRSRQDTLVQAFDRANGKKLRRASLIDQEYSTRDVFIVATDSEFHTADAYERARNTEQWALARESFDQLKPTLVSVPADSGSDSEKPAVHRIADSASEGEYDLESGLGLLLPGDQFDIEI